MPGRQTKTPKRTTRQSNTVPGSPNDTGILKPLSPKTPGWQSGRHAVFKTPESPSPKQLRTRRSSMYQSKMKEEHFESQSKTRKFAEKQRICSPPVARRTRRSSIYQKTTKKLVDIPLSPGSHSSKLASPKGVTTRTRRTSVYHKGGSAKLVQITEEADVTQKGRKLPVSVKPISNLKTRDKSGSNSTVTDKQEEAKPPRPATKSLPQKRKVQTPVKSPKAKRSKVSSPTLPVKMATPDAEKVTSPQSDRKTTSKTKKTPVKSLTAKTPAKSTRSSRSTSAVKDEVSSVTKPQAKQSLVKTPAAEPPVIQSKAKTPAAEPPVVQSKAKTPAAKPPVVQNKAKTPAAKPPVVQSKTKAPVATPGKRVSSPLKDTPILKSHKQTVLIQNNQMASAKKRKLSAENGDVNSPQPYKKHKSVESLCELKNVKRKSVIVQSPPGSGKRLKTPKKLPKTPVVKHKTTPARCAEVSSQKMDVIPIHVDQENQPLNITLIDEADKSITSQTSNELNTTYSHSSRCIIL